MRYIFIWELNKLNPVVRHVDFVARTTDLTSAEGQCDPQALQWLRDNSDVDAYRVIAICVPEQRQWTYEHHKHLKSVPDGCGA